MAETRIERISRHLGYRAGIKFCGLLGEEHELEADGFAQRCTDEFRDTMRSAYEVSDDSELDRLAVIFDASMDEAIKFDDFD